MMRLSVCAGLALALGTAGYSAQAEQANPAQQALRKAQGLLRQLSEEKAALEAENTKLKQDSDTAKKQAAKLEVELGGAKTGLAQLQNSQAELNQRLQSETAQRSSLAQSYASLQALQQKTLATLKQYQQDHALLVDAVKEREAWISQCGATNQKLLSVQQELLARYEHKSWWDALKEHEPLTGIGAVTAENATQDYQFKLDDLVVKPFVAADKSE